MYSMLQLWALHQKGWDRQVSATGCLRCRSPLSCAGLSELQRGFKPERKCCEMSESMLLAAGSISDFPVHRAALLENKDLCPGTCSQNQITLHVMSALKVHQRYQDLGSSFDRKITTLIILMIIIFAIKQAKCLTSCTHWTVINTIPCIKCFYSKSRKAVSKLPFTS